MYGYLNDRKDRMKIGSPRSEWKTLTKGLSQVSVMGPPVSDIFMNDMFLIHVRTIIMLVITHYL